ncbi:MAG: diguanylate cyclase, partial [Nitrospirota bacterium]|nr:diguanylate cyclase [Nitrospirota bacterium]
MSTDSPDKPPSSDPAIPRETLRGQVRTLQQHLHHLEQQLVSGSASERQQVASVLDQMMTVFQPLVTSLPTSEPVPLRPISGTPITSGDVRTDSAFPDRRDFIVRGHLITDVHGTIQLADRAMAELLHCPQAQLLGERFQDLFADDVSDGLSGYLQKIEQGEPGLEWDMSLSSKHGPAFSALITLTAIKAPDESIASVHWLIQDVTAHRRAIAADTLLQSLGAQILAGLTFRQLSELICDRLVQTFGYPLVWIGVQNAQGVFEIVSSAGTSVPYLDGVDSLATLEDFQILGRVMTSRNASLLSEHRSEWGIWGERMKSFGLESGLCVPLCSERAELGVLMVVASTPDAFGPVVVSWFEQLGAQLAVSLSMVKQYEQLRVRDAAIASAEHAVFITDPHGCIEWVNDAYTRLTGVAASELIGDVPSFLQSGVFHLAAQDANRCNTPGQYWNQELDIQHTDGRSFTVEQIVTPLRDEKGTVTHFVAIHHDITTRKESEAHIYHLAHYDSLTDLPNRVMFHDRLRQALAQARRYGHTVAVMFLDLDRFKSINDGLGHDCGDELLRRVAQRLTRCVRETDTVARLSGDEFAIILQDLERGQDSGHVAQKVLDAVSERLLLGDLSVATSASIGIALYPVDGMDPDVLLTRADRGMYRAKEKGGNCYQFVS